MDIKLKACPFCETADGLTISKPGNYPTALPTGYRVVCTDGCSTWGPMEVSEAEAILAWNTRAPDAKAETVAEIVAMGRSMAEEAAKAFSVPDYQSGRVDAFTQFATAIEERFGQ